MIVWAACTAHLSPGDPPELHQQDSKQEGKGITLRGEPLIRETEIHYSDSHINYLSAKGAALVRIIKLTFEKRQGKTLVNYKIFEHMVPFKISFFPFLQDTDEPEKNLISHV